jgi:hypothetical protein
MMSMLGQTHVLRSHWAWEQQEIEAADVRGGQADAAAVLHWEYRAVHLHDCEEEGEERAKGIGQGMSLGPKSLSVENARILQ